VEKYHNPKVVGESIFLVMRAEKTIEAKQIQNLRLVNFYKTPIASSVRDKSLMNPAHGGVYLIQCNVMKLVSDWW